MKYHTAFDLRQIGASSNRQALTALPAARAPYERMDRLVILRLPVLLTGSDQFFNNGLAKPLKEPHRRQFGQLGLLGSDHCFPHRKHPTHMQH